jgi:ketosteroid isomerase-like protein
MSEDPDFEVVRKTWAASSRLDFPTLLELMTEDVEAVPFGAAVQGRTYRGHDGVIEWFEREVIPSWEWFEVHPEEFQRVGDRLVVFGHWIARGRASGVDLNVAATWIVEVRDGKIARWETFTDRNEALASIESRDHGPQP